MYKPVPVKDYIRILTRKRIPYDEIIYLLTEGYDVFIPDMNRKTASYLKKKLKEMMDLEVECKPAEYEGKVGYVFMIPKVREYFRRVVETEDST